MTKSSELSKWYATIVNGDFKLNGIINVESKFDNEGRLMKYDLDENDDKTRVRYTYEGLSEMDDLYSNMNYNSAKYIESLRQYCQTGKGEAHLPSDVDGQQINS